MEKFCHLDDTIDAKGSVVESVLTRTRKTWNKFRGLVFLLASRSLLLGAKCRLSSACVCSIIVYGSEAWSVKEALSDEKLKLSTWMCNARH